MKRSCTHNQNYSFFHLPGYLSVLFILIFFFLVLTPLLGAVIPVLNSVEEPDAEGIKNLLATGRIWRLSGNSIIVGTCTAFISVFLGGLLGFSLFNLSRSFRTAALYFISIPILLAPPITGAGAMWIMGPAGTIGRFIPWNLAQDLSGPIILLSLMYTPITGFLVYIGRIRIQEEMLFAAKLSSSGFRIFLKILLPLLIPYFACGALLVFLFSLFNYTIPSLCRQNVLSVELILRFSAYFDLRSAAFLGLVLAFFGFIVLIAIYFLVPFTAYKSQHPAKNKTIEKNNSERCRRNKSAVVASISCLSIFLAFSAGIPLWGQATRFPSTGEIPPILSDSLPALWVTFVTSVIGAAISVLIGCTWALQTIYGRWIRGNTAGLLGVLPLVLPGPLLGIGLVYLFNRPGLSPVLDSIYPLAFAKGISSSAFAFIVFFISIKLIPREEIEALSLVKGSNGLILFNLVWNRFKTPLLFSFFLCFCLGTGKSDIALLLSPAGTKTLPVSIYNLYHFGAFKDVSVLSFLLVLLTLTAAAAGLFLLHFLRKSKQ